MSFFRKKYVEAGDLLLKVREKSFIFLTAHYVEDAQEFIDYFYKGLLQSKRWHISDNNTWKVIELHFEEDIYSETIEKIFEKNVFTNRKISLETEYAFIHNLKAGKTSLNKIYRSFQYAFSYNYLFCLFVDNFEEDSLITRLRAIESVFEKAALRKTEPLYCILILSRAQLDYLQNLHGDLFSSTIDDRLFHLADLNEEEIEAILNEFPLFRSAAESLRRDMIREIASSDNILLQLKNTVRKLSAGILPAPESKRGSLHIKKENAVKISLHKAPSVKAPTGHKQELGNDPVSEELDLVLQEMGTRFRRDNLKKILLSGFFVDEGGSLACKAVYSQEISATLKIDEKDIKNALSQLITKGLVYYDEEATGEIIFKEQSLFINWQYLIVLCKKSNAFFVFFNKLKDWSGDREPAGMLSGLQPEESLLFEDEDLEFFVDFYKNRIPGLHDIINILIALKPSGTDEVNSRSPDRKDMRLNDQKLRLAIEPDKSPALTAATGEDRPENIAAEGIGPNIYTENPPAGDDAPFSEDEQSKEQANPPDSHPDHEAPETSKPKVLAIKPMNRTDTDRNDNADTEMVRPKLILRKKE